MHAFSHAGLCLARQLCTLHAPCASKLLCQTRAMVNWCMSTLDIAIYLVLGTSRFKITGTV